jgi:hypothetical protein
VLFVGGGVLWAGVGGGERGVSLGWWKVYIRYGAATGEDFP